MTASEQRIYDFVRASLPDWAFADDGIAEFIAALVKAFDAAATQRAIWLEQAFIETADGLGPDWLGEHAKDRATSRQTGEDTPTLRERLATYPDALTRPTILANAVAIFTAAGAAGTPVMLDLRRDGARYGDYDAQTGTGGTFATTSGNLRTFTPDDDFAQPIEVGFARSGSQGNPRLVISGAADAANDGTHEITGLVANAVQYTDAAAADGADPTCTWSLRQYDIEGNDRTGRARAYYDRGYRYGAAGASFVLILPYGTDEAVVLSVRDMVRQIKAGGVRAIVEVRANP